MLSTTSGGSLRAWPPQIARWPRRRALIVLAGGLVALVGFRAAYLLTPLGGSDAANYLKYASYLSDYHHLPPAAYDPSEYSTPPLYESLAGLLNWVGHHLPSAALGLRSQLAAALGFVALLAASCAALASAWARLRLAGGLGLLLAAVFSLDEAIALGGVYHFSEGQLLSLACMFGLVGTTALLARELWPGAPRRALAAAAVALAYPIVLRQGTMFHPEMTLAFACSLALLLLLRAQRQGWPWRLGAGCGSALGVAALVRQSATIVIVCVGAAALLAGGRRAWGFLGAAAACLALLAGPWWAYATVRWGSPVKLALIRPGAPLLKHGEPLSFFVSFPIGALVTHPFRPDFTNQLLPVLHADLWSDWYGNFLHNAWVGEPALARLSASSQSVLGLGGDALGLAGLATIGLPAALRLLRRRNRGSADFAAGFLALVTLAAFVAFVATILRYPQADGKEIKASYLLFTTPCWALFATCAWLALARRGALAARVLLPGFAALYLASYAATLYAVLR